MTLIASFTKFHVEPSVEEVFGVCLNGHGLLTEMATILIYGMRVLQKVLSLIGLLSFIPGIF